MNHRSQAGNAIKFFPFSRSCTCDNSVGEKSNPCSTFRKQNSSHSLTSVQRAEFSKGEFFDKCDLGDESTGLEGKTYSEGVL